MSDKTLVERLREVDLACDQHTDCQLANVVGVDCTSATCAQCGMDTARALADAIEREYLPRPRFEDGEPVQFGDKFESAGTVGTVDYILKGNVEGCVIGRKEDSGCVTYPNGKRVKRPEPEVLDADGVPIHVGDTVWFEGESYRVTDVYVLDGEDSGVDLESFSTVLGEPAKTITNAWNELVTHKQPDSLERIEEDAKKITWDYWGCPRIDCCNCPVKIDGKNPRERYDTSRCHTAMTLDLLRRQREVLERGSNG